MQGTFCLSVPIVMTSIGRVHFLSGLFAGVVEQKVQAKSPLYCAAPQTHDACLDRLRLRPHSDLQPLISHLDATMQAAASQPAHARHALSPVGVKLRIRILGSCAGRGTHPRPGAIHPGAPTPRFPRDGLAGPPPPPCETLIISAPWAIARGSSLDDDMAVLLHSVHALACPLDCYIASLLVMHTH